MLRNRLLLEWLALLACAAALVWWLASPGRPNVLDLRTLDFATSLAPAPPPRDLVIVAVDDASLRKVGSWPWPRETHARLVDRLAAAGARQIIIDVLFLESQPGEGDRILAQSIRRAGNVILPMTFSGAADESGAVVPAYPAEPIGSAAAATGHVMLKLDPDGRLRRFDLTAPGPDGSHPQLAVAAARQLQPSASPQKAHGNRPIVPFRKTGSFPTVSAQAVIAGEVPASFLRGRVVLVGATAQGMGDRYATSAQRSEAMSGVEAQANLLDAIQRGAFIRDLPGKVTRTIALASLLALFLAFWLFPPRKALVFTILLAGLTLALALALAVLARVWYPPVPVLAGIALSYPVWGWRRLSAVSRFLDREAGQLARDTMQEGEEQAEGFDTIARQVSRIHGLIGNVRESMGFLRQVIEAAPDPILVFASSGALAMMNDKAKQLFPGWHEADAPTLEEILADARATLAEGTSELRLPDERSFLLSRARLDRDAAAASGEVLALRDITDIRRSESERQQMLEFLSHDMRGPQAAIIGLTADPAREPESSDRLARIAAQARRTLKLADDFVQLARLDHVALSREPADIAWIAQEAIDRAFAALRDKRIALVRELPDEPVFADVDASLIARMLDNLIGNAIKFSPEGSQVRVIVEDDARASGTIRMIVADEGPGLPADRLEHPFARFGSHDSRAGPSIGLGLALVKRVVDLHGGTIAVDSRPGDGTRFTILLRAEAES